MSLARGARFFVLLALTVRCAVLPDIPAGTCGNGVVEPPEDCDTFALDATSLCRPKGTAGECHLDCRARSDGTRPSCPAGWGCDLDGLCRNPTGEFEAPLEFKVGGASSLLTGDFDGDGRADILSREPLDAYGRAKLRFHYFDEKGALAETRLMPKLLASPGHRRSIGRWTKRRRVQRLSRGPDARAGRPQFGAGNIRHLLCSRREGAHGGRLRRRDRAR